MSLIDRHNPQDLRLSHPVRIFYGKSNNFNLFYRMPSSSSAEEVITIPDEPYNKRPRLESDVADNISVSSDSAKSIEISDDDSDDDIILDIEQIENPEITPNENQDEANIEEKSEETTDNRTEQNVDNENVDGGIINIIAPDSQTSQHEITESNIHEAKTQVPLNTSSDTMEIDKSPVSMEVVYDPNGETKVTLLEKMDDDNLPSTNDTDDVQITCGQAIQSSQELEPEKDKINEERPKENGINETDSPVENGSKDEVVENIEVKITTKEITVDDMLADFVDEVIEEGKTEA